MKSRHTILKGAWEPCPRRLYIIPEGRTAIPNGMLRRNGRSSAICADAIHSSASLSCGQDSAIMDTPAAWKACGESCAASRLPSRGKGVKAEYVQTDNGFNLANRFSNSKRAIPMLFEAAVAELVIRHKLIRQYTPRHNGKVAATPALCDLLAGTRPGRCSLASLYKMIDKPT